MRRFWTTAASVALVAALAACSAGNPTSGGGGAAPAAPVDPAADLSGTTLTLWTAQGSATEADQVIAAFEKATGATVEKEVIPDPYESNVPTRLAGGDKPDLMFWQPSISTLPFIQPRNNLLALDSEPWVSTLGPIEQQAGVLDGTRYAAVVTQPAVLGVYYNKAAFAAAGITTPPTSYSQLLDTARAIKQATPDVAPFFEVGGDKWPLQWQVQMQISALPDSFWDGLNRNEQRWTDPAVVQAINRYKTEVFDAGLAQPDYRTATFTDQGAALMAGSAAMAVNVTALLSQIQGQSDTATIDSTVGWFPLSNDSATALYAPDQTNGVVAFRTGDEKRQNAARQFLAFWLGPDYADYLADAKVPSIQPEVPSPAGIPQIALQQSDALADGEGLFQVKAINAPDMHLALADMIYGTKTPEQVADAVEQQFTQVAKAQGAPGF